MQHLAVFSKGVIEQILGGEKTIESRFAKFKFAPYKRIAEGDIVYMKESGGKVKGKFTAGKVIFLEDLDAKRLKHIKAKYGERLKVSSSFWQTKAKARYATLIAIKNAEALTNPLALDKHDKRSWVVLSQVPGISSRSQLALRFSDKDSISALAELIKLTRKEKGLANKEKVPEQILELLAAAGDTAKQVQGKKILPGMKQDLATVMIQLVKISETLGIDLFSVTKEQIAKHNQKISLNNLKKL
ncbi:hypothetical protein ACFL2B_00615 [Patescibacteria group bacterium]